MTKSTRSWIRNIVATCINGAASGIVLIVADPTAFNFENPSKLLMTSGIFALFGLANFLKQHPLPDEEVVTVEQTTTITKSGPPPAAVIFLALALGLAAPACASKYGGPVNPNPTVEQITATRELAIKIAGGVETASGIGVQALKFADGLEKSGVLPATVLAPIAQASSRFGKIADETLKRLETVASRPELSSTLKALFAELDPLLAALEKSGNPTLQQLAGALRIATTVARTVLT